MAGAGSTLGGLGGDAIRHRSRSVERFMEIHRRLGFKDPPNGQEAYFAGIAFVGTLLMEYGGPYGVAIGLGLFIAGSLGGIYIAYYN
jgi:hypothetical protein